MTLKTSVATMLACSLLASGAALAAGSEPSAVNLDQAKWGPAPPSLPRGAEFAVLSGDPSKKGFFVIALRGPQGYKVPPHWHSNDEHVTIISGNFTVGMGDKMDASAGTALTAGGYAAVPRRMHHWASAAAPFVIEVQASGPFDIHYVNPADNPMKTANK